MVVYTHMYRKINQIWLADITRFVHKEAKENECAYMKPLIYLFIFFRFNAEFSLPSKDALGVNQ